MAITKQNGEILNIARGTHDNLSEVSKAAGQILITTDEHEIYVDKGTGEGDRILIGDKQIEKAVKALNSDAVVATKNASTNVVTLKGGIIETEGEIANAPTAALATVVDGYLYNGVFYEDSSHTIEITPVTSKSYKDKDDNDTLYNQTGYEFVKVRADIALAAVASTGAASDVTITDVDGLLDATNVEDALAELAEAAAGGVSSKTIYVTDNTSTSGTDYAKIYKIYQGDQGDASDPDANELVATINIPKDYLVKSAERAVVTAADKATDGKFENDSDFAIGDKYIDFTVNAIDSTGTESHIYINLNDLVDAYTAEANADEIQLAISNTNEISASVVEVAGTKIGYTYSSGTMTESVTAALTRLDGDVNTTGSVAKAVADGIATLDGSATIASKSGDVVTIKTGITEADGVIDNDSGTDIVLEEVATTGAAADVSIADAGSYTSQTTVEGAIQEIYSALTWGTF